MKTANQPIDYEQPLDLEIFEAYMNKNAGAKRADIRRMRRDLRKLTAASSGWLGAQSHSRV